MPNRFKWSPSDLTAQTARLLDDGWDCIFYWFQWPSVQKKNLFMFGRNVDQAHERKKLERAHAERAMPMMRYYISIATENPPIVEDEICRVSLDGINVIASDFMRVAAGMDVIERPGVYREECELCKVIWEGLWLGRPWESSMPIN